uniref:beta strand repeat-containing protein n=1 Tax=Brucella endophytica TaxID=1963359 RepID=UPI0035BC18A6
VVTFDGGTLKPTATNNTDFISGFTGTPKSLFTIAGGGMTIDTTDAATGGGFDVTALAVLSGTGALTKGGLGTLTLSGANTFLGGLTVNGGTVAAGIGANNSFGSGTLTVAAGATANLNNTQQTVAGLIGAGNISLGTNSAAPFGKLTVNYTGGTAQTYSGNMTGTGSLVKGGTGNLELSGNNQFSGGLTINAGTVTAGSAGAYGSGVLTVNSGGVADLNGYSMTVGGLASGNPSSGEIKLSDNTTTGTTSTLTVNQATGTLNYYGAITGPGSLVKEGAGTLTLSGANTFSGGLTVNAGTLKTSINKNALGTGLLTVTAPGAVDITVSGTKVGGIQGDGKIDAIGGFIVSQDFDTVFSGDIIGASSSSFTKQGTGNLTLSGDNQFPYLIISEGTLTAGKAGAFGGGQVTVAAGAKADLAGFDQTFVAFEGAGNVDLGSATLTDLNNIGNRFRIYSGLMSGSGAFVLNGKTGGGLTFSNNNTFTGGLTVNSAIMKAGIAGTAFGKGKLTVMSPGSVDLDNFNTTVYGLTGDGAIALGSAALTVDYADTATAETYSGQITGGGSFVKEGAGALTLSGNNQYIGGTVVNEGTLMAGSTTAFGAQTNILTVDGGTADLGGFDITLGGLDSSANVTTGTVALGGNTLTINQATASLDYWGAITGTGALIKQGSGAMILSGDSSAFTGATTVGGGILQVDGTLGTAGSSVAVNTGATLQGKGTIGGNATVNDGGTLYSYTDAANISNKLTIDGGLTV